MMANNIVETNVGIEGTINNEEIRKAITILKYEEEAGHERNIANMTQEYYYKSSWNEFKNVNAVSSNLLLTIVAFLSFQGDL